MNHHTYRSILIGKLQKCDLVFEVGTILFGTILGLSLIFVGSHLWDVKHGETYYVEGIVQNKHFALGSWDIELETAINGTMKLELPANTDKNEPITVGKRYSFGVKGDYKPIIGWYPNIYKVKELGG